MSSTKVVTHAVVMVMAESFTPDVSQAAAQGIKELVELPGAQSTQMGTAVSAEGPVPDAAVACVACVLESAEALAKYGPSEPHTAFVGKFIKPHVRSVVALDALAPVFKREDGPAVTRTLLAKLAQVSEAEVGADLERLVASTPGVRRANFGITDAEGYTHALTLRAESRAALDAALASDAWGPLQDRLVTAAEASSSFDVEERCAADAVERDCATAFFAYQLGGAFAEEADTAASEAVGALLQCSGVVDATFGRTFTTDRSGRFTHFAGLTLTSPAVANSPAFLETYAAFEQAHLASAQEGARLVVVFQAPKHVAASAGTASQE